MRKGNKTKLIVALLSAALTVNAFAFAPMAALEPEFEMEVEFVDVPDESLSELQFSAEDEAVEVQLAEAELQGVDDSWSTQEGSIIEYNGRQYMVVGKNIMSNGNADGTFEVNPDALIGSDETDRIHMPSYRWVNDSAQAHSGNTCLAIWGDQPFIWRHVFSSQKLYMLSMWFKFEGSEKNMDPSVAKYEKTNLLDSQRHIAGAIDVATGQTYNIGIGDTTDIVYGTWQQEMCVFKGTDTKPFIYMVPTKSSEENKIFIDDIEIFEVIPLDEIPAYDAISIDSMVIVEENNPFFPPSQLSGGKYNGIIYMNNASTVSYNVRGVLAVFRNGKLDKILTQDDVCDKGVVTDKMTLVPSADSIVIEFDFAPAEGAQASEYSFMMYLSSPSNIFEVYGSPSDSNPFMIMGGE